MPNTNSIALNTIGVIRYSRLSTGLLLISLSLAGCAIQRPLTVTDRTDARYNCRGLFAQFDQLTTRLQARDFQTVSVHGFPYLRVDRLLATLAPDSHDESKFAAWVNHLRELDQSARRFEYANLPAAARNKLEQGTPGRGDVLNDIAQCGESLRLADLKTDESRQTLVRQAKVPDNYRTAQRVIGLYPLSALVVRASVSHWQRSVRRLFADSAAGKPPPLGVWLRYRPPGSPPVSESEVADILRISTDPLGIPIPTAAQLAALLTRHAPVWELDSVDDNDRPGRPYWGTQPWPQVDVTQPVIYTHVSYTRFGGHVLLQLNYTLWFAARTAENRLDILAGRLDGIHWRVTLGADGRPLLYDSIHPCGCYHLFFPGGSLRPIERPGLYHEPILVAQTAPSLSVTQRLRIRVSARSHYIQQILVDDQAESGKLYQFASYDMLRSLPIGSGDEHRSLFAAQGLVPGTQRGERWLLWPMGIPSPGAMRQWGTHATAFVGRRHFDEAFLIDRNFSAVSVSNP